MSMNGNLRTMAMGVDLQRRVLGPANTTTDAFRSMKAIENALMPSNVRMWSDMQRGLESLTRHRIGNFEPVRNGLLDRTNKLGLDHAANIHGVLKNNMGTFGAGIKLMELHRAFAGICDARSSAAWRSHELTRSLKLGSGVAHQLAQFEAFDRRLRRSVPEVNHRDWSIHLTHMAVPSLAFLAQEWARPVGLVTELSTTRLGASATWLDRSRGEPLVTIAALTEETAAEEAIEVDVDPMIECALCGGPLQVIKHDLHWIGPRKAILQVRLIPACRACVEECSKDPNYLRDAFDELSGPIIGVRRPSIPGGQQGNGRPCGKLSLVRLADDEEDGA